MLQTLTVAISHQHSQNVWCPVQQRSLLYKEENVVSEAEPSRMFSRVYDKLNYPLGYQMTPLTNQHSML